MTNYRNKYLEMLKTDFGKKPLPQEPSKPSKFIFEVFEGTRDRPVSAFSPPYDAEGVPCGVCPSCGRASSGAIPSSTRTMIPAAGCAGSAPLRPRVVVPATSAACPRTTNDDSNG